MLRILYGSKVHVGVRWMCVGCALVCVGASVFCVGSASVLRRCVGSFALVKNTGAGEPERGVKR